MGVFGQSGLKSPTQRMESTTIKGVGVHKRAFAKLTYVGGGIADCSGTIKSIESDVKKKHSELLSSEGGRITAAPSLESISISNDGGQNIEDAMLFQADVKLKCYNSSDFDQIEKTFMTPGHRCNIGIGYAGTGLETIQGDVVGFNFSINYDLSYDITIKLGGVMDSVLSADFLTLSGDTKKINKYKDPESGDETVPKDIIGNLVGEASQVTTEAQDGKAKVVGNIGLVNHQMDMSWWQNNDNNISYVTLQYLIDKRNIEIVPLAYMRGRTLNDACIILDEAQNATISQIKMFLTRLGENSKMIITGDETQIDLNNRAFSGLKKTRKTLSKIEEVSVLEFENIDIVRNKIVSKI